MAFGDLNEDGRIDIAWTVLFCDLNTRLVLVLLSRPGIPFSDLSYRLDVSGQSGTVAASDVNADGHQDLVILDRTWVGEGLQMLSVSVAYGSGFGTFFDPVLLFSRLTQDVQIRDMNGDGIPVFVVSGGGPLGEGVGVLPQQDVFKPVSFIRGNVNDEDTDLSDAISILEYLFLGGAEPPCEKSADIDDTGVLELTDGVYLLHSLFTGGPAPENPFAACGPDVTADDLTCESFPQCEE